MLEFYYELRSVPVSGMYHPLLTPAHVGRPSIINSCNCRNYNETCCRTRTEVLESNKKLEVRETEVKAVSILKKIVLIKMN